MMARLGWALVALLCLLLIGPVLVVVVVSFSGDAYLRFPPTLYSLQWYERFLGDGRWLVALANSAEVAALACVLATVAGFLAAYAFARGVLPFRGLLMALILLPLIVPTIITAISLYFLSARWGLVGSRLWLAVAQGMLAVPVVVVIIQSVLRGIDPDLEKAALVHGASRFGVIRRIVLPLALPGTISAALFAFLSSFDELVVALFLSGVNAQTLPVRIWNSLTLEVEPTIAAVSTLLIAVTLLVLGADQVLRRPRAPGS